MNAELRGGASERPAFESAISCLKAVAEIKGLSLSELELPRDAAVLHPLEVISQVGRASNLEVRIGKVPPHQIHRSLLPVVVEQTAGTYVVLLGAGERLHVFDPGAAARLELTPQEFQKDATGVVIEIAARPHQAQQSKAQRAYDWLWDSLKARKSIVREIVLISLLLQILSLAGPIGFQLITDKAIGHQSLATLNVLAIALLAVACFEVVLSASRSYLLNNAGASIDAECGPKVVGHLLRLPVGFFESKNSNDLLSRVWEVERIRSFATNNALVAAIEVAFSLLMTVVLFIYSWQLALVVVAAFPLYAVIAAIANKLSESNRTSRRDTDHAKHLFESIESIATVKAIGNEALRTRQWAEKLRGHLALDLRTASITANANEFSNFIAKGVSVIVLWIGAKMAIDQELTVGQLVAFNMISARVTNPISKISQRWADISQVGAACRRIGDLLSEEEEGVRDGASLSGAFQKAIDIQGVTFAHSPRERRLFSDLDLQIPARQLAVIYGSSGSGKTTLLRLIQGSLKPQLGNVRIHGVDVANASVSSLRRTVGAVGLDQGLFKGTIRENLIMAKPSLSTSAIQDAAKAVGIHEAILGLGRGYDTSLDCAARPLSSGMRQGIILTRALLSSHPILALDDAACMLDQKSQGSLFEYLSDVARRRTVVVFCSRLNYSPVRCRYIGIANQKAIDIGSREELIDFSSRWGSSS